MEEIYPQTTPFLTNLARLLTGTGGATGPAGPTGSVGPAGPTGPAGVTGPQGIPGVGSGSTGPIGPVGPQGATGVQGLQGSPGPTGAVGSPGPTGTVGATGPQGSPGVVGPAGATGPAGAAGAAGTTGPRGDTGPQGIQGVQGSPGVTGTAGVAGATGPQGATGPGFSANSGISPGQPIVWDGTGSYLPATGMAIGTATELFTRTLRWPNTVTGAINLSVQARASGGVSGAPAFSVLGQDNSGLDSKGGDVLVRAGAGISGFGGNLTLGGGAAGGSPGLLKLQYNSVDQLVFGASGAKFGTGSLADLPVYGVYSAAVLNGVPNLGQVQGYVGSAITAAVGGAPPLVEVASVRTGTNVVAVAVGTPVTVFHLPTGTGDRITFFGDTATGPVPSGSPSMGSIVFVTPTGGMAAKGYGGWETTIVPNMAVRTATGMGRNISGHKVVNRFWSPSVPTPTILVTLDFSSINGHPFAHGVADLEVAAAVKDQDGSDAYAYTFRGRLQVVTDGSSNVKFTATPNGSVPYPIGPTGWIGTDLAGPPATSNVPSLTWVGSGTNLHGIIWANSGPKQCWGSIEVVLGGNGFQ